MAGCALAVGVVLGAAAVAAPAGAATTARSGCSYYTPDECSGGGGGDDGGYTPPSEPGTPTHTPMIDPGLFGLAAAAVGGGAGSLVLRKRARQA
jgi:hypothetical protein